MENTTENVGNKPFKTFSSEEELTNFINKKVTLNEKNLKSKFEKEIKEKLEKEAQLSAEEKLNERIKELENEKKAVLIDKNRTKAEKEFVSKGLENYSEILDFVVNEDEEITLQKTKKFLDFIEVNSKKTADEKIKKAMKDVSKPENSEVKDKNSNEEIARKLGKFASETHKTALETIKKYL